MKSKRNIYEILRKVMLLSHLNATYHADMLIDLDRYIANYGRIYSAASRELTRATFKPIAEVPPANEWERSMVEG